MALFSTTEELKEYLPATGTFDFAAVKPYIHQAEVKYIMPYLGVDQFNQLRVAYQANSLSSAQTKLLELVRIPLANFAFALFVPVGQLQIAASGIQQGGSKDKKAAAQWQIDELQASFMNAGYDSIDPMLEYLEENKLLFPAWAGSSAYTVLKQFFINTARQFSEFVWINESRRTFLVLRAQMKKVEEFSILSILCKPLFAELKAQTLSSAISEANQVLLDLIRPAVAHLTIARAIEELSVVFSENGIQVSNSTVSTYTKGKQPAPDLQLQRLKSQAQTDGETYLAQIRELLEGDLDAYPLYRDSPCYQSKAHRLYQNDPESGLYVF
jgi:hypothetical protein